MAGVQQAIGRPIGRLEGPDKVTGQTKYVKDLTHPGALVGRCLRSPVPYARIRNIDATAARNLAGVNVVITGFDIPDVLVGRVIRDIPVLPRDLVRFAGQKVAAVAAESQEIAEEALLLIDVEYEELPAVFSVQEAMAPGAPILHPNYNDYEGKPAPQEAPGNLASHLHFEVGDVGVGFAEADYVYEHTFETPHQHQGYLEAHACIVEAQPDGRVEVWVNSKVPFLGREYMSVGIDVPESQIRFNPVPIGGDFGGKGSFMDTHIAYFLSKATGHPVSMNMDYIEEFQAANPRHPSVITFKTGVKRDGTITARQARAYFDGGGYAALMPIPSLTFGKLSSVGAYRIPHAQLDSYRVYTNRVPCGFMRGPGESQLNFAGESQIDIIAHELGMDPYEFRMRNLPKEDDPSSTGGYAQNVPAEEMLRRVCQASGYFSPKPKRALPVGRGISVTERGASGGESTSQVTVATDGSVTLRTAVLEVGTGIYTILRQIVAQELGVAPEEVELLPWSTDDTRFDSGTKGSSGTHVMGTATMMAASQVKEKLVTLAADLYGWPEEAIVLSGGKLEYESYPGVTLAELVGRAGQPIEVTAEYKAGVGDMARGAYRGSVLDVPVYVAQVAEIEVDPETGQVHPLRFTTTHDSGTIINPLSHQGQIEGGFVQGLGFAMMEEIQQEQGRPTTVNFGDYKMPNMADIPELNTVPVEAEEGPGPYGSKGAGEHSTAPVPAALANAVYDAVGVRITQLPITAERVYRALQERGKE